MQAETTRSPIVVRRPSFELTSELPAHWNGDAFATHVLDGLSSIFPDGEAFFVRAVRHYADRIEDPELKRDVQAFAAQEGRHKAARFPAQIRLGRAEDHFLLERFVVLGFVDPLAVSPVPIDRHDRGFPPAGGQVADETRNPRGGDSARGGKEAGDDEDTLHDNEKCAGRTAQRLANLTKTPKSVGHLPSNTRGQKVLVSN